MLAESTQFAKACPTRHKQLRNHVQQFDQQRLTLSLSLLLQGQLLEFVEDIP